MTYQAYLFAYYGGFFIAQPQWEAPFQVVIRQTKDNLELD